ncbi:hypothetical protein CMK14_23295, partial [Candidatus Poribacteria bacterium]|nr:hypothetical protein [Candidatus Poribacteria bacterium]
MQKLNIKRLDQHAIVAAVIDDLTMVQIVDGLVSLDFQEKVSTGMALKAMILNGLGCSNRPLTLTAQFFANIPLEHILGPGITAKHFNRHQIGRLETWSMVFAEAMGLSRQFALPIRVNSKGGTLVLSNDCIRLSTFSSRPI